MPFKSLKQERFMFAEHPQIANKWAQEFGGYKSNKTPAATEKAIDFKYDQPKEPKTPANNPWAMLLKQK